MNLDELKRAAQERAAAQREELARKMKERADERSAAEAEAQRRQKERAEWLARERAKTQDKAAQVRKDAEAQRHAKRAAAAAAAQKAAVDKAKGREQRPRTPAFEKAKADAALKRAQLARPSGDAVLTREEKRQKRLAKELGVPFKRQSTPKAAPSVSRAPSAGPSEPPRRKTAREAFLEQEARRKRAAPSDDEYDSASDEESDQDTYSAMRDEIWTLFGKKRQQYLSRDVDSDDDMEAGASDVLNEEQRSALYARREDEREEQALLEAKRRKLQKQP